MRPVSILAAALLFLLYAALIVPLLSHAGAAGVLSALGDPRVLASVRLSVLAALAAACLAFLVALPAGYALSRHDFPGRRAVDALLELPLVVSPVALGAALLLFFNTGPGRAIEEFCGGFVYAVSGVVLAQFVTSAGLAARLAKAAFDAVPRRAEAVAASLGAPPATVFLRIVLPQARRGLLAAFILTFAKCVGEFGATVTLAGAMPGRTETLPVSIYLRLSSFDLPAAAAVILILLALGLSVAALARALSGERA